MSAGSKCWVNIPTDVVYKLKGICAKHTLHNRSGTREEISREYVG